MPCEWACPDCGGKCGIDFAVLADLDLVLTTTGVATDHEDFHQACDAAPGYGGTD